MKFINDLKNWEEGINQVLCGDCLDLMKKMPDNCVDLVITSPPYDDIRVYDENGEITFWQDFYTTAEELKRILKKGGVIVWVVDNGTLEGSETLTAFDQINVFVRCFYLRLHDTMIYQKTGIPFPSKTRYNQTFEYMFILSKGKPKTINLIKDKKNAMAGSSRKNVKYRTKTGFAWSKGWTIQEYGIRDNIWKYKTGSHKSANNEIAFEHPAIFPENLVYDHLISWSKKNDLVFDPFMGSWTTARVCKDSGRKFIGAELSEKYCEIGEKRLKQEVLL